MLIHAPAKVNLFLELRGKLDTGYHELETVMATVSWFDTVAVQAGATGKVELKVCAVPSNDDAQQSPATSIPQGRGNLVVQAVEALRQEAGVEAGLSLVLVKRIPVQAGLGGGSSDAAAALVGANHVWGLGYSPQRLAAVAAEIGSDVPFFLYGGVAQCLGRGERILPLPQSLGFHAVVVKPPVGLSTADVYKQSTIPDQPRSGRSILEAVANQDIRMIGKQLFNRLAEPARQLTPWVDRLERLFAQTGSLGYLLSGSGSACFGIFPTRRTAQRAAHRMKFEHQLDVSVVRTLAGGMRWGP